MTPIEQGNRDATATAGERAGTAALEDRLRPVFIEALGLAPDVDVDAIRYRRHPTWDSLGHMALVVAIEDAFGVELDPGQLIRIDSLAAAAGILRSVGVPG